MSLVKGYRYETYRLFAIWEARTELGSRFPSSERPDASHKGDYGRLEGTSNAYLNGVSKAGRGFAGLCVPDQLISP